MGRSASFKGSSAEDTLQPRATAQAGGSGSLLRSGRGLRLGLGAVTRTTTGSAKGRGPGQGQRSTLVFSQPIQPVSPATSQKSQDNTGLKKKNTIYYKLLPYFWYIYSQKTTIIPDGDGLLWATKPVRFHFSNQKLDTLKSYLILLLLCSNEQLWDCFPLKLAWDEGSSLKCILLD